MNILGLISQLIGIKTLRLTQSIKNLAYIMKSNPAFFYLFKLLMVSYEKGPEICLHTMKEAS